MSNVDRGRFLLFEAHRPDLAEAELLKAMTENPQDARAQALLAQCLGQQGKTEAADAAIAEALRLAPDSAYVHSVRGWLLGRKRRYPEAEAAYREALRLEPDEAAFEGLAWILIAQDRYKEALKAADAGLVLAPESVECLNRRAEALLELRHPFTMEAQASVTDSLRIDPNRGWTHALQGMIYRRRWRNLRALRSFAAALALDPSDDWPLDHAQEILTLPRRLLGLPAMIAFLFWLGFVLQYTRWPLPWNESNRITAIGLLSGTWWLFGFAMRHQVIEMSVLALTPFRRLLGDPAQLGRCRTAAVLFMALGTPALLPLCGLVPKEIASGFAAFVLIVGVPWLAAMPGPAPVPRWRRLLYALVIALGALPASWVVLSKAATDADFGTAVWTYTGILVAMCLWTLFDFDWKEGERGNTTLSAARPSVFFPDIGARRAAVVLGVFAVSLSFAWWVWVYAMPHIPQAPVEIANSQYGFRLKNPGHEWTLLSGVEARNLHPHAIAGATHLPNLRGLVLAKRLPAEQRGGADDRFVREVNEDLKMIRVEMVQELAPLIFLGAKAQRCQFTASRQGEALRVQYTEVIRDDVLFRIVVFGAAALTESDGSSFRAFEGACEFMPP